MLDLVLAMLHHLAVFSLAGIVAAELALLRRGVSGAALQRLARIDAAYGGVAATVLVVGFLRVFFGAAAADVNLNNPVFWAKIGAFAAVGLLSIQPTVSILSWRREAKTSPGFVPSDTAVVRCRKFLLGEAAVFVLIPVFAAAMARGFGLS